MPLIRGTDIGKAAVDTAAAPDITEEEQLAIKKQLLREKIQPYLSWFLVFSGFFTVLDILIRGEFVDAVIMALVCIAAYWFYIKIGLNLVLSVVVRFFPWILKKFNTI